MLDVRSPAEYDCGHIQGAYSLPIFSNDERAIVGTAYKNESREAAVEKGLAFWGPKMKEQVENAKKTNNNKTFLVHCWRGGMRSSSLAWLLELYGFKIYLLRGGYKSFRRKVLESFAEDREILISIGGEEKKADKKKCDKNKACCKKDSEAKLSENEAPMGKSCQGASKSKSCCKGGKKDAKTAETAATPAN